MIVRPAREEDLPAIVEIVERCGLGVDGVTYGDWTGLVLVCVRQAEVIGFMAALPGKPYAVVTEYGVLPEHQKGRAAYELWKAMEVALRVLGCRAWGACVASKKDGFRDVVTRVGAVDTGEAHTYMKVLG